MANYNVKYRGQFRDVDNILWTVDILKEGTVGTIEEITLADPPVNIEYQQEDVFQPLKCSAATIRVLTPKILDIYTGKIDVKIQIYKDNVLFWEGWNTPNIYSSEYATDLDLIEINAIDNIAALEYSKYNCKNQINVLKYKLSQFFQDLGYSVKTYQQEAYLGGIEIRKIVIDPVGSVTFTFAFDGVDLPEVSFYTVNMDGSTKSFNSLNWPVTALYNLLTEELSFQGANLEDITQYPYTQRTTEYNPSRVTMLDILNRTVDRNIIYYSENDLTIDDIYINEDVFLDEDDEPLSNKEVLEHINRYLGTTMYQWGDKYYMVDIINYHKALLCGYSTTFNVYYPDGTQSTFATTLTIPEMVVSENNSQISYGDIYNQITVQAKLDVEDADKTGDIFKDIDYINYESPTTTNNRYEIYHYLISHILEKRQYEPDLTTTTFDENYNVTSMDSFLTYSLQYVDESAGYNKNLYYPHPSFDKYYKYTYQPATWNTAIPDINLRQATANMYIYRDPQECFKFTSDKIININGSNYRKNLVIGLEFYLANTDEPAPWVNKEEATKYEGTVSSQGEGIINFLWAKVQIGEKYWNGFNWTTTPEWFTIGIGGEETTDTNIKSDNWYSVSNTTSPKSKLTGWSIPMSLGAYLNGNVTVTLGIPQFRKMELYYVDGSAQGSENRQWDWWRDERNTDTRKYANNQQAFTNLDISSIYIKNFTVEIESNNTDEDLSTTDLTYSQELDNTLVQSMDDITMLLNTYNEDLGMDMSSSYVLLNNGIQYLTQITNYGLSIKPEQQVVHKYCNYYQKPKLIASNTFYMNQVEPLDIISIPYLDNYYMVGDIDYDLRYKQVNITGYEI